MIRHAFYGLFLLAPGAALAAPVDYGSIDGYGVPHAELRAQWPGTAAAGEGTGFGLRVLSRATETLVVLAEAEHLDFDDGAPDFRQYRVGAGLALPSTTGAYLTYDRLDFGAGDADAFGAHLRVAGYVAAPLMLYGQAGYVGVDTATFYYDGFELTAGAAWDFARPWGAFLDYRARLLDDRDGPDQLHQESVRVGVRFRFDC